MGLIAAALPLVAAGAAQAALAGAGGFTSSARPDLVSATLTGANSARFCFNKPITSVPNPGGFSLGGYRADAVENSTTATASGNCVNVGIPVTQDFTFGQVGEGAVRAAGNQGNRADSTALSGSTTQNGTRGLTTAPDLQGISGGGTQQIAYTFDEPVDSSAIVGNGGFHFVVSSGTAGCTSGAACDISSIGANISATDPNVVIAQFPIGGGTPLVSNAVRGYILPGTVESATDLTPSGFDSAPNATSSGVVTGVPTLTSAAYSRQPSQGGCGSGTPGANDCVVVDYTFSEGVTGADASNFYAYLSDGSFIQPDSVSQPTGPNTPTVRAFYNVDQNGDNAAGFDEYLVKAGVNGAQDTPGVNSTGATCPTTGTSGTVNCGVVSAVTGHPNTPGSAPIGGNTGAHSSGFSTAPEAFQTTFDTQTNTIAVTFDQRTYAPGAGDNALADTTSVAEAGNFQLLGSNGDEIAGGSQVSSCSPASGLYPCPLYDSPDPAYGPGQKTVYVQYNQTTVAVGNAKGLEIRGYDGNNLIAGVAAYGGSVFNTDGTGSTAQSSANLQQILAPAAIAAGKHFRVAGHTSHVKMTSAVLHRALAKTRHHTKKHHKHHSKKK